MSEAGKLLTVDDEPELCKLLSEYLSDNGFEVRSALDAESARQVMATDSFDLVLLDIRMPGEDGLSLARWMREQDPPVGIIMLTTQADVVDRVVGLEVGADDYIAKPFDLRELLARVKSVLRCRAESDPEVSTSTSPMSGRVRFGRCTLDLDTHKLFDAGDREVPITAKEFELLQVFSEHPNQVLNRDRLMELAHNKEWDVYDRSIDLRIMRLRRKIEQNPEKPEVIKTIRGMGYMFVMS